MVEIIAIAKAWPYEILPSKSPDFKCFWTSDPYCNTFQTKGIQNQILIVDRTIRKLHNAKKIAPFFHDVIYRRPPISHSNEICSFAMLVFLLAVVYFTLFLSKIWFLKNRFQIIPSRIRDSSWMTSC